MVQEKEAICKRRSCGLVGFQITQDPEQREQSGASGPRSLPMPLCPIHPRGCQPSAACAALAVCLAQGLLSWTDLGLCSGAAAHGSPELFPSLLPKIALCAAPHSASPCRQQGCSSPGRDCEATRERGRKGQIQGKLGGPLPLLPAAAHRAFLPPVFRPAGD